MIQDREKLRACVATEHAGMTDSSIWLDPAWIKLYILEDNLLV